MKLSVKFIKDTFPCAHLTPMIPFLTSKIQYKVKNLYPYH